jgi:hypothetical protein
MEQRCNRFIFAAAVVEDDGGDTHKMADVRGSRALAGLPGVNVVRVTERVVESAGKLRHEHDDRSS